MAKGRGMTAPPRRMLTGLALCLLAAGVLYALAATSTPDAPCSSCDARHKQHIAHFTSENAP